MKVFVVYDTRNGPAGGGNQFLKALSREFFKIGVLAISPEVADAFLFNSHHNIEEVIRLKLKYENKPFIHRIDGPMSLYNKKNDNRDKIVYWLNKNISDGTIYQSQWSKKANISSGLKETYNSEVIINAPDSNIFNKKFKKNNNDELPKIIATSWSKNINKGFDIYEILDKNYVGDKFSMTFVGNSPIKFINIEQKKAMSSEELSHVLKQHDIFITASKADPCSNSLIEALHSGLPSIVMNDGGHPEIVKSAGFCFDEASEIPDYVDKIMKDYDYFVSRIDLPTIEEVAGKYLGFIGRVFDSTSKIEIKQLKYADFTSANCPTNIRKKFGIFDFCCACFFNKLLSRS